jgi:hypothetical protein
MTGANPTAPSTVSTTSDTATLSPQAQALADAQATTARRDASLARLAEGPVVVNGTEVSQRDGYRAISDASWDRFQGAMNNLPDSAKAAVQDQLTVVQSDWVKKRGAESFNNASPETQQELAWMWQAQAAGNYGRSAGAQGNAADLTNLADGARQYIDARSGYLQHGGVAGE